MIVSSFAGGFDGWQASYADYLPGMEQTIGFASGHEQLPPPFAAHSGVFLTSENRSDDVFMYLWRPVTGLQPGRRYRVEVAISFATNAPAGCNGVGGAPGESVYLKVGASPRAPENLLTGGAIRVNVDIGQQSQSGSEAVAIGDFSQPAPGNCLAPQYQSKSLATTPPAAPLVTADAAGRLWLVVGTDSGYEGRTRIYFLEVAATLTPA